MSRDALARFARNRPAIAATTDRRLIGAGSGRLQIIWTDAAIATLDAIHAYVRAFDSAAADRLVERFAAVADSLASHPNRDRDAGGGRREMTTVWPYVIRYRVTDDTVVVLRIRHGARDEEPATE